MIKTKYSIADFYICMLLYIKKNVEIYQSNLIIKIITISIIAFIIFI